MTALPLTHEGLLDGAALLTLLRPDGHYHRPEPTPSMVWAAEWFGLTVITQPKAKGCLVAALAMLTKRSYDVVASAIAMYQEQSQTTGWEAAIDYLVAAGFTVTTHEWPDGAKVTPRHPSLCRVSIDGGAQAHGVVLLPCGTVIDPLMTVPTARAHYMVTTLYALTPARVPA